MWTRSPKNERAQFKVECYDWFGNLFFRGYYNTVASANNAGENAERRMTAKMQHNDYADEIFDDMDAEELYQELMA